MVVSSTTKHRLWKYKSWHFNYLQKIRSILISEKVVSENNVQSETFTTFFHAWKRAKYLRYSVNSDKILKFAKTLVPSLESGYKNKLIMM